MTDLSHEFNKQNNEALAHNSVQILDSLSPLPSDLARRRLTSVKGFIGSHQHAEFLNLLGRLKPGSKGKANGNQLAGNLFEGLVLSDPGLVGGVITPTADFLRSVFEDRRRLLPESNVESLSFPDAVLTVPENTTDERITDIYEIKLQSKKVQDNVHSQLARIPNSFAYLVAKYNRLRTLDKVEHRYLANKLELDLGTTNFHLIVPLNFNAAVKLPQVEDIRWTVDRSVFSPTSTTTLMKTLLMSIIDTPLTAKNVESANSDELIAKSITN